MELVDKIKKVVADFDGVTVEEMESKSRKRPLVFARMKAIKFIKKYTPLTLESIGSFFGGRDHSTINHALTSVQDELEVSIPFVRSFKIIEAKIHLMVVTEFPTWEQEKKEALQLRRDYNNKLTGMATRVQLNTQRLISLEPKKNGN